MKSEIIKNIESYISETYQQKSPDIHIYHSLKHTSEVVNAVQEIGKALNVSEEELELLTIAAWFHDIGYVECCDGHEKLSAELAADYLKKQGYPESGISKISSLILATKIPQNPKNLLEEIICDADLHHLGVVDFAEKGDMLRREIEQQTNKKFSDVEWLKNNVKFFNQQNFFTTYAKEKFEVQKNINLNKIKKMLKKAEKKEKQTEGGKMEMDNTSAKLNNKAAGRGIETMFRNTMRTHVAFSSMADTKANIMISVNTLVLTIIVSVMIRKLDSNPHLVIPTALLTVTSLLALIYAILVTRPKITSGTFSSEDIKNKKANLLFFGNFYNVPISDFSWGMKQMIQDQNYLYDAMITDFYYLGQVLGKKYKQLRICYTIFMYGIIISVIAFTIAYMMYPDGTNLNPLIE